MSLAVTTTNSLTIIDGTSLKRHAASYDFRKTPVLVAPRAHVWSTNNSILYLVSSDTIHSFSPTSCTFTSLYSSPQGTPLQPVLALKDKSTLIFAQGSAIHLFSVGSGTPRIISSLIGHSAPVNSLSVCNDASLLASSSGSGTLCVHNFAHNSLTVLKGIPSTPGSFSKTSICMFHPHTRTRLLVGCGKTLVVYDTTRPSGPLRSILLSETDSASPIPNIGHIVAISCSPFSKTLTAVAFSSGFIALVDLEKGDRPFFKSLQLKDSLTSLTFTADGTSLAVGTENGKVIVPDLRATEHDHRTLTVCDEGKEERIIGLSIQRRIKTSPSTSSVAESKPTTTAATLPRSLSVPLAQYDLNNSGAIVKSPARRIISSSPNTTARVKSVTPAENRLTKDELPKRTFPPSNMATTNDGGENLRIQIDTIAGGASVEHKKIVEAKVEKNQRSGSRSRLSESRTTPSSAPRAASIGSKTRPAPKIIGHDRPSSRSSIAPHTRSAKTPVTSPIFSAGGAAPNSTSNTTSLDNVVEQPAKHTARNSSTSEHGFQSVSQQASGSVPSVHNRRTSSTSRCHVSRTPTPDLPPVDEEPSLVWRDAVKNLNAAINIPGVLSTPGIEQWVEASREKTALSNVNTGGKQVGWVDSDENVNSHETEGEVNVDGDEPTIFAGYKGKNQSEIQLRPSHPEATSASPLRRPHIPPTALQISPLQSLPLRVSAEGTNIAENESAQELLRAVVMDVMYEYRQETREDIKGLHLDLLRMGRSWKTELRSLMDEYVGDLRELREENVRLRKENERLRRGF